MAPEARADALHPGRPPYSAAVEFLIEQEEDPDPEVVAETRARYAELVERARARSRMGRFASGRKRRELTHGPPGMATSSGLGSNFGFLELLLDSDHSAC